MPPPYTMYDFMNFATQVFSKTTGPSPRVQDYYKSLSKDFLDLPITPDNINEFVKGENNAVLSSPKPPTQQDYIAIGSTPFRGVAAHFVAQNLVVGQQGFFGDNEYQKEALMGILSDK